MTTDRHTAAPTEADVALSDTIRTTLGALLYSGGWPRVSLLDGIHLTERMDAATARGNVHDRIEAGRDLLALAKREVPDAALAIIPRFEEAA